MKSGLLGCLLILVATQLRAHRLDECLQATRVAVATNRIDLSIDLTPGVAVADQVLAVIDQNRDGQISRDEGNDYARRILNDLRLGLDDQLLALTLTDASFPALSEIRDGLGIIRVKASASVARLAAGAHTLSLTNSHLLAISVYLVNALVPKDPAIKVAKQTRDELQRSYQLEFRVSSPSP